MGLKRLRTTQIAELDSLEKHFKIQNWTISYPFLGCLWFTLSLIFHIFLNRNVRVL